MKLLVVEDEPSELNRIERAFLRLDPPIQILRATDPVSACNQFRRHRPEVVLLDLGLSGYGPETGLELVAKLSAIDRSARIVVLTGHTSEEIGIEAIENGAASFLTKPADLKVLGALVRDYGQTARFRRSRGEQEPVEPLPGLIGHSTAIRNICEIVRQCAATEASVLIVGETGTGKELIAQAVHQLSTRRSGPLSVYFGAVPASMAESELFGYVRGAFTGASPQGSEGAVAKANGGTLFIDELCSLDLEVQRKLLRVIEDKTFKPLGANHYRPSDFRLVCAAQPRIYDLVRSQTFREDLLARVEVVTIHLPPLRERPEDILLLAEHFQKQVREELLQSGIPCNVNGLTREVTQAFLRHTWPRNVRELKHLIHQGMLRAQLRGGEKIDQHDVQERMERSLDAAAADRNQSIQIKPGVTLREAVEELERRLIVDSLSRNQHVVSAVCQELGLGRTTLWRKLKHYGLQQGMV